VHTDADIAIIGAGAAGLFASIWAGREPSQRRDRQGAFGTPGAGDLETNAPSRSRLRLVALDGAKKLGAKILVAGGGRCNVTHHEVDEQQYAGSSRHAIKKVLRRFDVPETVSFFRELGVHLKREQTGKLFPTTDDAHTVLNALLDAARHAEVELRYPWRVGSVRKERDLFVIEQAEQDSQHAQRPQLSLRARKVILATGGMALPRSGSDGAGYDFARALGHSITPRVFPALVPLTLPKDHWICQLLGITLDATLEVRSATNKRLKTFTNSTLLTHFGLSGPSVLDISRYYAHAKHEDAGTRLVLNWVPGETIDTADAALQTLGKQTPARWLKDRGLPERLAEAIVRAAGVDPGAPAHTLFRDNRKNLAQMIVETPLPVTGDRGFTFAEVTAGGVPLGEIHLDTMESRVCPGLYLCGEICDVDGRIGGFNFQWAWASGFIAGTSASEAFFSNA
jgi:predicted Rossmann fold flavoprotein